jgi:hypothetical protein
MVLRPTNKRAPAAAGFKVRAGAERAPRGVGGEDDAAHAAVAAEHAERMH